MMTPLVPTPTMDLLLFTSMGDLAALSYVQSTQVPLAASHVSWIHAWPFEVPPGHLVVLLSLQHLPLVVPSVLRKSQVRSIMMVRGVLSVSHVLSLTSISLFCV